MERIPAARAAYFRLFVPHSGDKYVHTKQLKIDGRYGQMRRTGRSRMPAATRTARGMKHPRTRHRQQKVDERSRSRRVRLVVTSAGGIRPAQGRPLSSGQSSCLSYPQTAIWRSPALRTGVASATWGAGHS